MITLTVSARDKVKRLFEKEGKPNLGLRVGVRGGGCSGMTYVLAIDEATPREHDMVFDQDEIKVLIDSKSHRYLDGTTIDYQESAMGGGFTFDNPLARKSCGCGTSFAV